MNKTTAINKNQVNNEAFGHAIVIGSSIAGLTAARILTEHFAKVTIIERDHLSDTPDFRYGVPQARHVHVLRLRGQKILEQQFPGLIDELLANGAELVNTGNEADFHLFGQWRTPPYRSAINNISASRPLLEATIYQRVTAHSRVTVLQEQEVINLKVDERDERVIGVQLHHRGESHLTETELLGDLVVDASGRQSKAVQWLESLGYGRPRETVVNAFPGYTTVIYRRPPGRRYRWKTMYIIPTPPDSPRGGVIVPLEGDRWLVTLVGMGGDFPPNDEAGFLDFARSLPSQRLYEAIKEAEPLTKPHSFRRTENRLRHYDQLPRYLEGFLVVGDAVCGLNPIHAQGMSVAAMGSLALEDCLQTYRQRGGNDLKGLARDFQKALGQVVAGPWIMATSTDRRWPTTEGVDEPLDDMTQLQQTYFTWVLRTMVHNPIVAERFFHVQHMLEPPTTLFRPEIMDLVLRSTPDELQETVDLRPFLAAQREMGS
jgi:2-polyprenyl-6-methoxyphenol hydroxylase-like FAD-dependent oxidoreductase